MKVISQNQAGKQSVIEFDSFTFSGGEEHIRFNPSDFEQSAKVKIFARLTDSSKLIQLMVAQDALKRLVAMNTPIELIIPYFPYARQDRVCVSGEALGAAVMANFINQLAFSKVTIWDAHSDVTPALLNNVVNVEQYDLLERCEVLCQKLRAGQLCLVSPDAGATKKTLKIAEKYAGLGAGISAVIQAQKVRDLKTGKIIDTQVLGDVSGKEVLITDDICDGGRTFIELGKVLKEQGATQVSLFVTHGIFSKGLEVFDGVIDAIYTTDSFRAKSEYSSEINNSKLTIIEM